MDMNNIFLNTLGKNNEFQDFVTLAFEFTNYIIMKNGRSNA